MADNYFLADLLFGDQFIILVFPFLLLVVLFLIWRFHGQIFLRRPVIITEFTPPSEIGPAEAGVVFSGFVSDQALTGEIIKLAVDGFIRITPVSESRFGHLDFQLEKLRDIPDKDHWYRRVLINLLFSSGRNLRLSDLSRRLDGNSWNDLRNQIMFGLKSKGYYHRSPVWEGLAYFLVALLTSYLLALAFNFSFLAIFSGLLTFIMILAFGFSVEVKTAKGREAARYLAGFKRYLDVAEKDRLLFHYDPKKPVDNFEKILPYAVALGVEGSWDNEFAELFTQSQSGGRSFYGKDVELE